MKSLYVLKEFPYNQIGSFRDGNPYSIQFCYTNPHFKKSTPSGEFIVKGGSIQVSNYLKRMHIPMVVFISYWRHGQSRGLLPQFINFEFHNTKRIKPFYAPSNYVKMRGRWFYRNFKLMYDGNVATMFRKIPRKWIPEYDTILNGFSVIPGSCEIS